MGEGINHKFRLHLTRLTQLKIIFLCCFGLVAVRLFYWQVIRADTLVPAAIRQLKSIARILPQRGKIWSADGYPLVLNQAVYTAFYQAQPGTPRPTPPWDVVASIVRARDLREATAASDHENIMKEEVGHLSAASAGEPAYAVLAGRLNEEQKKELEVLGRPEVGFEAESIRYYPEASLAARLLGFVGKEENGSAIGYFGLEGYYDSDLKGKAGFWKGEKNAFLEPIFSAVHLSGKKMDGRDLILSIDRTVQYIAESELADALVRYQAKSGLVIIADPQSGAIQAMASLPAFDPDRYWEYRNEEFINPAIAETYEPGSTFKVLVMAMAYDLGAVDDETVCPVCHGPYQLDKYTINTWNNQYYPDSKMSDIIVHSDNVGMVYVASQVESQDFRQYLERFGFGRKTGIDLQGEAEALLKKMSYVDQATAAFGQGIAVTPIQMVQAVSAIANGGTVFRPSVVSAFQAGERRIANQTDTGRRVIRPEIAATVTAMMVRAVNEGEAKWLKPKEINVAGKTGTAQIPLGGQYLDEKTIASFIGFAPAEKPRYLILTLLKEPGSSPWGSETAAPLFFRILHRLMLYQSGW